MSKGTAGRERQTPGAAARGVIKRALAARDVMRSITGRKRCSVDSRPAQGHNSSEPSSKGDDAMKPKIERASVHSCADFGHLNRKEAACCS